MDKLLTMDAGELVRDHTRIDPPLLRFITSCLLPFSSPQDLITQHPAALKQRADQYTQLLLGCGDGAEARAKGADHLATFQPPPLSYEQFKRLRSGLQVASAEPLMGSGMGPGVGQASFLPAAAAAQ